MLPAHTGSDVYPGFGRLHYFCDIERAQLIRPGCC